MTHFVPRIESSHQVTGLGRRALKEKRNSEQKRTAVAAASVKEKTLPETSEGKCIIAVRIRGQGGVRHDIEATLDMLKMTRKYNAVLLYEKPDTIGMLKKAKDYITWGEPEKKILSMLLEKRCRPKGTKELTPEYLKDKLQIPSVEKLAEAIERKEITLTRLHEAGIPMVFRLHPPRGGFKGPTKRSFGDGGELGYRGAEISHLISRMI